MLQIPIPTMLAEIQGGLMQFMPEPMVTRDQVLALQYDNVATGNNSSLMVKTLLSRFLL